MKENFFVYCDGASRGNPGPSAAACLIFDSQKKLVARLGKYLGRGTNNEAEYQAVILALEKLKKMEAKKATFFLDSLFVVKQLNGKFRVKDERMKSFFLAIKRLIWETGIQVEFRYISRSKNTRADSLANKVLDKALKVKKQNERI